MNLLNFNGTDLQKKFGEAATLGTVFKAIETDLKKVGEVVCQFKVNGLTLDEATEKRLADSQLSEVQTLDVLSQRPSEILGNVLKNWCSSIPEMIKRNDRLATDIRFKGIDGQLKVLVALIDDCQLLVDSLISIDQVFPQLPIVQSGAWKKAQTQMAMAIGEALAAFQKKDFTQLADILEYEMGHSLQVWVEILTLLQQNTGGHGNADATDGGNAQGGTT